MKRITVIFVSILFYLAAFGSSIAMAQNTDHIKQSTNAIQGLQNTDVIQLIETSTSGNETYLKYFLKNSGNTYLCTDKFSVLNGVYRAESTSNIIKSNRPITRSSIPANNTTTSKFVIDTNSKKVIETTNENGVSTSSTYRIDELVKGENSLINLKAKGKRVSGYIYLKNKKLAVGLIATAIAVAIGASSSGVFAPIAAAIISECIHNGLNRCPNRIYYTGTVTTQRSGGRIYHHYYCSFYKNAQKKKYYGRAHWSRRWGH